MSQEPSIRNAKDLELKVFRKYNFTPEEKQFIYWTSLPKALRPSRKEIERRLGITKPYGYDVLMWHRDDISKARLEMTKRLFLDDVPDVMMAMRDEAVAGNVAAATLFIEYIVNWSAKVQLKEPDNKERDMALQEAKEVILALQKKVYGEDAILPAIEGEVSSGPTA